MYYDPTKEVTFQVDASSTGLGAALLQDKKPAAFASKALMDTKSCYANIERELLPVLYGCEHFHTYLYSQSFIAESDHTHDDDIRLQERQVQQKYYHDQHTPALPKLVPGQQVTIQNPKTLDWKPAVVLNKAGQVPRSYIVSTPGGKELHRNRSHIPQVPQTGPKQVKIDFKSNQACSSSPGIDLPINILSQPNPRSSAGPLTLAAQSVSPTPGAVQLVTSAPRTGSHYVTCNGRVVKAPSRMDIYVSPVELC